MSRFADDEDVASMMMRAGSTVLSAEELVALAPEEEGDDTQYRLRCRATARRSRSLSPSRRSPKLHHTNGRLEATSSARATLRDDLARLSVTTATAEAATECAYNMDLEGDEFVFEQGPFPDREEVRRCQSCLESNRRSRLLQVFRRDEGFRQLCAQNTRRIIATAMVNPDSVGSNNDAEGESEGVGVDVAATTGAAVTCRDSAKPTARQQKLAMKALKYRKLLKSATDLDEKQLADPSFDVLEYLSSCKA